MWDGYWWLHHIVPDSKRKLCKPTSKKSRGRYLFHMDFIFIKKFLFGLASVWPMKSKVKLSGCDVRCARLDLRNRTWNTPIHEETGTRLFNTKSSLQAILQIVQKTSAFLWKYLDSFGEKNFWSQSSRRLDVDCTIEIKMQVMSCENPACHHPPYLQMKWSRTRVNLTESFKSSWRKTLRLQMSYRALLTLATCFPSAKMI